MSSLLKRLIQMALGLLCVVTALADAPRRAADEASVVVAYLYNFSKFIEWPSASFEAPKAPIHLCFYGDENWSQVTKSLSSKRVRGHPVEAKHIKRGASLSGCHLLYISESERLYIKPLLRAMHNAPVLTVSAIEGFASSGGVIGLTYMNKKLKFEINAAAAEKVGLKLSSQLLKVAVAVVNELPQ